MALPITKSTTPSLTAPKSWNRLVRKVNELESLVNRTRVDFKHRVPEAGIIKVVNISGVDFDKGQPVKLGSPLDSPSTSTDEYKWHTSHEVTSLSLGDDFVIMTTYTPDGEGGKACISGYCYATVTITDAAHKYAKQVAGVLVSSEAATKCEIIDKAAATGTVHCRVLLSTNPGDGTEGDKVDLIKVTGSQNLSCCVYSGNILAVNNPCDEEVVGVSIWVHVPGDAQDFGLSGKKHLALRVADEFTCGVGEAADTRPLYVAVVQDGGTATAELDCAEITGDYNASYCVYPASLVELDILDVCDGPQPIQNIWAYVPGYTTNTIAGEVGFAVKVVDEYDVAGDVRPLYLVKVNDDTPPSCVWWGTAVENWRKPAALGKPPTVLVQPQGTTLETDRIVVELYGTVGQPNVEAGDDVAYMCKLGDDYVGVGDYYDDNFRTVKLWAETGGGAAPKGWAVMNGTANAAGSGIDLSGMFVMHGTPTNTESGKNELTRADLAHGHGLPTSTTHTVDFWEDDGELPRDIVGLTDSCSHIGMDPTSVVFDEEVGPNDPGMILDDCSSQAWGPLDITNKHKKLLYIERMDNSAT